MLPALHYTHFCLLLIFKCSVERLQIIRKWVGYYGKMPFPSFHCCLGACYTQALNHAGTQTGIHRHYFTLFWIPQKNSNQIKPPKEIPVSKISNPKESFDHPGQLKSGVKIRKSRMGTRNKQQNTYRSVKGILVNLLHTSLKKTATKRCRLRIVPNSLWNCASKPVGVLARWLIPVSKAWSS